MEEVLGQGHNVSHHEGLPVVIRGAEIESVETESKAVIDRLVNAYVTYYGHGPGNDQLLAWRGFVRALMGEIQGLDVHALLEYPVLNGASRIDALIVGNGELLVVEGKGWGRLPERYNEVLVTTPEGLNIDPCIQARSYANKLRLFYPDLSGFRIGFVVYYYNVSDSSESSALLRCPSVVKGELRRVLRGLAPPTAQELMSVLYASPNMRPFISEVRQILGQEGVKDIISAISKILTGPYGVTKEQALIIKTVLNLLERAKAENKRYLVLIEGPSGSGKTIVALSLFLIALTSGLTAVLGYRNSRLLKTIKHLLREIFIEKRVSEEIISYIDYSYVGNKRRFNGLCESGQTYEQYGGSVDLLILDEAQRIAENVAELCPSKPVRVIVAFYDKAQALIMDEIRSVEAFEKGARTYSRGVIRLKLPSSVRIPDNVIEFVYRVLVPSQGLDKCINLGGFRVVVHRNLDTLREYLVRAHESGKRVALICSFTETMGDMKKKLSWTSKQNIRIDRGSYKIKWLMHDELEYANYWKGDFDAISRIYRRWGGPPKVTPADVCASVYGAQGFDAEIVGVIWGKDLMCRSGKFTVDPSHITDYVGGRLYSLRSAAKKRDPQALRLLLNRYYIMLTRATKELHIYFEDEETLKCVTERMNNILCNSISLV